MEWCLKLVEVCDEVWLFGISEGTLQEAAHALQKNKPLKICGEGFDLEWKEFSEKFGSVYGEVLERIQTNSVS